MKMKLMSVATLLTATLCGQINVAHAQDWRKDAQGREVDCSLTVGSKTYLKGTCVYDADADGSFRLFGDKYFVYLNVFEKSVAGVSWNGKSQASHAQESLGEDFKRDGACWVGKQAKVCAWDKTAPKASKSTRIKFAKGAVSATVSGTLNNFDSEQVYVIAVNKGQTLTVEQTNQNAHYTSIYLTDPQGEDAGDLAADCHNRRKIEPTLAGDYTIRVVECLKADPWKGKYSIKVTVK